MTKVIKISCPEYTFNKALDLTAISRVIDKEIVNNFVGLNVIIRGIQSEKHNTGKNELIDIILHNGYDRTVKDHQGEVAVSSKAIDLFGYACKIEQPPIVLPILEGFHKWKPKSLEKPQRRVDIWMIYDAEKLTSVEYTHEHYGVTANDAYLFKNPLKKPEALLGLIVID